MTSTPSFQKLEKRVMDLEAELIECRKNEAALKKSHKELERRIQGLSRKLSLKTEKLRETNREHENTEKALRESEGRYRALFENNPIETITVDKKARVTEYNLAKKMSGCRLPNIGDVMYKDYAAKHSIDMFGELLECINSGILKEFPEQRYDDKYLFIRISPFSEGAIITSIDITEYKKAGEALRESKEYLSEILNRIADPIYVKDRDHLWVLVNDKFCEITGALRKELLWKSDYDFFPKQQADISWQKDEEVFSTGRESFSEEFISHSSTGEAIFLNTKKSLYEDKNGNKYIVAIGRDLTARKRAEEALRESEEKFRALTENTSDITVVIDSNGINKYISPSVKRTLDYSPGEIIGKDISGFVHPDDFAYASEVLNKALCSPGETITPSSVRLLRKNGSWVNIEAILTGMTDVPGIDGIVVNCRDISEKIILQAEAMRAGHLASLGELAAGVAHEINNPINGVINYAEILKDDFEEDGRDSDIPNRIIKEGERIAQIVRNLLSFARDQKEDCSYENPREIFLDSLSLVERQLLKDGIILNMDIPSSLPMIEVRSGEIQQIFLNIFSNARYALNQKFPEFSKEKLLEIIGETVVIEDLEYVRIIFHDHGMGIPANILDKVCNPFFSTKPKDKGTGLGLSISHGIVKNHGGKLWFESVEGEFSKVIVDLPVNNTKANSHSHESRHYI